MTDRNKRKNKYIAVSLIGLGLVFYSVMILLPGVVFLFWPVLYGLLLIIPVVLIFPTILLFCYKQKLNAILYVALPTIIYTAIGIYLSMRSWVEKAGISVASSLVKSNGFGLLRGNYSLTPRLIYLGICGAILTSLYALCFLKKIRWRWLFVAFGVFLIVSLVVFWHYIKML